MRRAALAIGVPVALALLAGAPPALADDAPTVGVWWQLEPSDGAIPPPRSIPAGGLWFQSFGGQDSAVSAFRVTVPAGRTPTAVVLKIAEDLSLPAGIPVDACATTTWNPPAGSPGAYSSRPFPDCGKRRIAGRLEAGTIRFDVSSLGAAGTVDLVLARPAGDTSTAFDVTFGAPTLTTTAAPSTTSTTAPAAGPSRPQPGGGAPPATDAPVSPGPALGPAPSVTGGVTAPDAGPPTTTGGAVTETAAPLSPTRATRPGTTEQDGRDAAALLAAIWAAALLASAAAIVVRSRRSGTPFSAGRYTIYRGAPPRSGA